MKWRPPLWFVLFGGLGGTLLLSFLGLIALRNLQPVIGFRTAVILLALAITLLTGVLGWLLARLLLRPVHALSAYARALQTGAQAEVPRHYGTQELRRLAGSVMDMGEALRARETAIRTYTDHVTHELKTPVSAVRAASELLEDADLSPPDRALVEQIKGAALQFDTHLNALRQMSYSRAPHHHGTTTVSEVLARSHTDLPVQLDGGDIPLPLSLAGLSVVLGHILDNSAQVGATKTQITVDAQGLTITDDGPGISPGNAPNMFEPFFTTRRETGGTGMGLAIVQALLRAHGWSIARIPTDTGLTLRLTAP